MQLDPRVTRVRRSPYVFVYLEDEYTLDINSLLRGELAEGTGNARIVALSALTSERLELSDEELKVLRSIPAERWVDYAAYDAGLLDEFALRGLVVVDAADGRLEDLRRRDEALSKNEWNPYGALYHFMTQWRGVEFTDFSETPGDGAAAREATVADFIAEYGPPPPPFPEPTGRGDIALPGVRRDGGLYRSLASRRTTRSFDPAEPMTLEQLDTVLRYVFGCHGLAEPSPNLAYIRRTSPSGGGLHPIEVYPIIADVTGVPPGIYRYNGRDHSLSLLEELNADGARNTATSFMCGQRYFGEAHVSFVLTARFYRNHWKYRRHPKAYAGILMDAAHLSQTLYLVSADLGLGAFITIAINARDIEDRLGLDGASEGVIAMAGCGVRTETTSPLELDFSSPDPV